MPDKIYLLVLCAIVGVFFIMFSMIFLQAKTQNRVLLQKKTIADNEILHQKALSKKMIISQEEERKRIGRDLHDEVGTSLSALRMLFEKMKDTGQTESFDLLADVGKDSIDNIINNVRKISHNLSPFTKGAYELIHALEDVSEQMNRTNGPKVSVCFKDTDDISRLDEDAQLALYRILLELMNNTLKHASAFVIRIDISRLDDLLIVNYSDDGIGMTDKENNRGIGMFNIESRCNFMNAVYAIDNEDANGFRLEIQIPLIS